MRTTPGAPAMRPAILGLLVFTLLTSTFATALPECDQSHSSIYHSIEHSTPINLISSYHNGLAQEEVNNNNHIPTPTAAPILVPAASDPLVKVAHDSTPIVLRPITKPSLITDFEFETMWDPQMNTLRLGVLLPFNAKKTERVASLVRKGLSVRTDLDTTT